MSIEIENVEVASQEVTAERRWSRATRALVGLAVFTCFLMVPEVSRASSIFTAIIGAVSAIASVGSQITQSQTSMHNYNTTVVAPPTQTASLQGWMNAAQGSYTGYLNSVQNVSIKSASLSSTTSLENAMRSGNSGGNGSSIASSYNAVYGTRLTTSTSSSQTTAQSDSYDTRAQEGMTLAAKSDNGAAQLITTAKTLQTSAASTAPGTAAHVAAQAQVLQLQSYAMQHRLFASMLRQEATKIANESSKAKAASSAHSTASTNMFGGNQ